MSRLVSSKHLESVSDLTLSAPVKQGFIDAFEAVTYETPPAQGARGAVQDLGCFVRSQPKSRGPIAISPQRTRKFPIRATRELNVHQE